VRFDFSGDEVASDDAARYAIDNNKIEHFHARKHGDGACFHLALERLIGTEQKLLAGLTARIKRARHLRAAERTIGERAAIFARERHALGHALINDVDANLRQTIHVGFAGAEIAAFDGVIEQTVDAIAVILIVLGGVDTALGGNRMARRGES